MTHDEKRFLRREIIAEYLYRQSFWTISLKGCKRYVRDLEVQEYGVALNIYSRYGTYLDSQ